MLKSASVFYAGKREQNVCVASAKLELLSNTAICFSTFQARLRDLLDPAFY